MTLWEQMSIALSHGETSVEEVLRDIDRGDLNIITVPGGHVVYRIDGDTCEIVSLYGDMELAREWNAIARIMGATNWKWAGRKGWMRVLQGWEADYGRQS